jgi:hypothetical protein
MIDIETGPVKIFLLREWNVMNSHRCQGIFQRPTLR